MKVNKILTYISLCLSVIFFYLIFKSCEDSFVQDIYITLFGVFLILLLTSISNYFASRSNELMEFDNEMFNLYKVLKDVKYLENIEFCAFQDYCKNVKHINAFCNEQQEVELYKEFIEAKKSHESEVYLSMKEIISQYVEIKWMYIKRLKVLHDNLSFFINNRRNKKLIGERFIEIVGNLERKLSTYTDLDKWNDFYLNSKYHEYLYESIRNIQQELFNYIEIDEEGINDLPFKCEYNKYKNVYYICYNQVVANNIVGSFSYCVIKSPFFFVKLLFEKFLKILGFNKHESQRTITLHSFELEKMKTIEKKKGVINK